ncbi:MAG: exodeoxyribonuclease VII large subunit [Firmicutes bacterium]|nr:exodeoxyribonuclease VII large subunit [Bacillota bacterium]
MLEDFITVAILNAYIARLLDHDPKLQDFWLKGEISGFRHYQQSGHLYFTLKDEDAAISCVMFRSKGQNLKFKPEDGMEVILRGNVAVFTRQGKYQVYVAEMQPFGRGGVFLYLEKLKARLAAEGYFALESKKNIPRIVTRVGVVTSQDGAALHDILRVIKQRHSGVEVVIAHSSVQGPDAPRELAEGIQLLNTYGQVEVIIIGRGGGSLEDLMAFNSEELVRAIYESNIPVISGVGHEVDNTLCDLAADLRAATPTQAAQFAIPEYDLLQREVESLGNRLARSMQRSQSNHEERLDRIMMKKVWREPGLLLRKPKDVLAEKQMQLEKAIRDRLKEATHQLTLVAAGLDNLSPLRVMARGYAIFSKDGRAISDIQQVDIGDNLQAEMANGRLQVLITGKEKILRWKT